MKIKNFARILLLAGTILMLALYTSCNDDESNKPNATLPGTWQLVNAEIDVTPAANATMSETQLEAFLANYTFFSPNSQVVFTADSITLTAELVNIPRPTMTLPYQLSGTTLTIEPPILIPSMELQGEIKIEATTMEFDLSPASYKNVLNFIGAAFPDLQSTIDQIASAEVDYTFKRVP